jgi:hypothetical protein
MKIIKKVNYFKLYFNVLYYSLDKSKIIYIDNIKLSLVEKLDFPRTPHWFFEDENYLGSFEGDCYLINSDKGLTMLNNEYYEVKNSIGISYKFEKLNGKSNRKETLFHLPEEKQIFSEWLPNKIYHIQDQYWANDTEEDFKLIDAERGEILWAIPQPEVIKPYGYNELTNIKKVLGIYKGNLWLQLPDSRFLVLDIYTGSVKHELKHDYFIVHEKGSFFDSEEGIIKILFYNLYLKYSLTLMQFIDEKNLDEPEIFQVTNMISRQGDNFIYFTAKLNDVSMISNAYGIFDTKKKEVVFQGESIEEDGFFYQAPQVNDELFTILDSKGNLIIHKMKDILKK